MIQCAEQLEAPREVLEQTYTNSTWQNETLDAVKKVARGSRENLTNLGFKFGLDGYLPEKIHNGDKITKTVLQYIENHDHSRLVCNFGTIARDNDLLQEGDRNFWYKVQPYLIGMFAAKGIPMLWQGQEFCENYYLPEQGFGRVMLLRPVRWDYFYDSIGQSIIALVRKLIKIRREQTQFTGGNYFFYNNYDRYQSKNLLLFSRQDNRKFSLVAINFGDSEQSVPFWFPIAGDYQEELHGKNNLINVPKEREYQINIPSNYGRIWTAIKN